MTNIELIIQEAIDKGQEFRIRKPDYILIDHKSLQELWFTSTYYKYSPRTHEVMYRYAGIEILELAQYEPKIEVVYKSEG